MVLEANEPLICQVRASQIQFLKAQALCFLDRVPKQERYAASIMEAFIGTSILVYEASLVAER